MRGRTPDRRSIRLATAAIGVLLATVTITRPTAAQQRRPGNGRVESYERATIDRDGNLRIVTSDRRTIIVRKAKASTTAGFDGPQTSFDEPVISNDRRAVGAAALFKNCCTSYDIPLQVVVYSGGTLHRFVGELPIFAWHFEDGGSRIAFSQEPLHFGCFVHWELREIVSERRVAQVDVPEECGQIPNPPKVEIPRWVRP